jgi:hypothetical protein
MTPALHALAKSSSATRRAESTLPTGNWCDGDTPITCASRGPSGAALPTLIRRWPTEGAASTWASIGPRACAVVAGQCMRAQVVRDSDPTLNFQYALDRKRASSAIERKEKGDRRKGANLAGVPGNVRDIFNSDKSYKSQRVCHCPVADPHPRPRSRKSAIWTTLSSWPSARLNLAQISPVTAFCLLLVRFLPELIRSAITDFSYCSISWAFVPQKIRGMPIARGRERNRRPGKSQATVFRRACRLRRLTRRPIPYTRDGPQRADSRRRESHGGGPPPNP